MLRTHFKVRYLL